MKISHDWLRAFVPHQLSVSAIGELLSRHVVTLDGTQPLRADLAPIVVARVVESERIPDTKLSFNKVDDGTGTLLEVVCGAPNVTVGTLYPFARAGTVMPGGLKIEKRKIRGFTSNGMLCSARELGLGDDHDGILPLSVEVPTGTPFLAAMPVGDVQLDLDVLPNRPDLLSHHGVARELAALLQLPVQLPEELHGLARAPDTITGATAALAGGVSVRVDEPVSCPRYVAAVIRGVTVGPSPAWLRQRIESVGGRSINNVVDATNYVLHGLGQPVHAFDLGALHQHSIVVRKAKAGERLTTLDGLDRALEPWMTIIADGDRATALAGVMGGRESEVTEATKDVLLEVASFDAREVRRVRQALGITSDASYRFERGVDRGGTAWVARLAAGLVASVAGGTIESLLEVGAPPRPNAAIALRPDRASRLLGVPVAAPEIEGLLSPIGFGVVAAGDDVLMVGAPSWRHDVMRDVDLIEEIARLRGYDTLPDDLAPFRPSSVPDHPFHVIGRRVRDALVAEGLSEARPMPFTKGLESDAASNIRVTNPLTDEEPFLRTSVLDTLARCAEYNLNRHQGDVRLFEVGDAFTSTRAGLPREEMRVAALIMGERRPRHFTEPSPPSFDEWDAKALGDRIAGVVFPHASITMDAGQAPELWVVSADGVRVGGIRRVALDAPVWASSAFGVEIAIGVMPSDAVAPAGAHLHADPGSDPAAARVDSMSGARSARFVALPTTPAASFDVALLVRNDMDAATVERVIRAAGGNLLESVSLFDEFRGPGVPEGSRSLAWRLTFRHPERTLREKEIDGRRSQLLKTLEAELGVVARTA